MRDFLIYGVFKWFGIRTVCILLLEIMQFHIFFGYSFSF